MPRRYHHTRFTIHLRQLILSIIAVSGAVLMAGCGPREAASLPSEHSSAPACEDGSALRSVTPAPYVHVILGLDISTSYPAKVREEAQATVAGELHRLVRPGPGGLIQVNFVGRNSYHLENSALDITLPPVAIPAYASPPPSPRNKLDARERKQYQQDLDQWCQSVLAENAEMDRTLEAARAAALSGAEALRSLTVTHEDGTDFKGFFARSAERFSHDPAGADKLVIIASDAEPWPDPTRLNLPSPLPGVRVIVSQWATNPDLAARIRQVWRGPLEQAGVISLNWFVHRESLAPAFP